MILDLSLLGVVLLFAILGYFQGAIGQLVSLGAIVAAVLYGKTMAQQTLQALSIGNYPVFVVYLLAFFLGLLLYIFSKLIIYAIDRLIFRGSPFLKQGNKLFGLFLGSIKGVLVAFILAFLVSVAVKEKLALTKPYIKYTKGAMSMKMLDDLPFMRKIELAAFLHNLRELTEQGKLPGGLKDSASRPIEDILKNSALRELLARRGGDEVKEDLPLAPEDQKVLEDLYQDPAIRKLVLGQ